MPSDPIKQPSKRLYQNDIVQKLDSKGTYGVILRCWHDPEDIPPQDSMADPLLRPLKQGEVGVSYITHSAGNEILDESKLKLVDRCMQPGDFCKRSVDDMRSGVVTAVHVRGRLAHVISGEVVDGWKTTADLLDKPDADIGDYIVYDDWVGQIIEVFDESIVEVEGGRLVRLPELGSRLAVGDEGPDILPPAPLQHGMQSAWRSLWGGSPVADTGRRDRVIGVKHSVYAIAWLAMNQLLEPSEVANKKRPQRFWTCREFDKLTVVRGRADSEMRIGDRVYLKDAESLPVTEHGNESDPAGVVHVQTFSVIETVTELDVLWQDGIRERVRSTELIPYLSPDEYDCWPGDHVLWKTEDAQRYAVVQTANPAARIASLRLEASYENELVSVLELDHGSGDPGLGDLGSVLDGFGVRRGDFVFIHKEGTTNGSTKPRVPRIGELEPWVRDTPYHDGHYCGWRKDMGDLGNQVASDASSGGDTCIKRPVPGDESLHWIGEVAELRLDGTVDVTHPDWTVKNYSLERLTRLYDGMEQLEDEAWGSDEGSEGYDDDYDAVWAMGEDGQWQRDVENVEDWEDVEDGEGEEDIVADGFSMDIDPPELAALLEGSPKDNIDVSGLEPPQLATPSAESPPPFSIKETVLPTSMPLPEDSDDWKRFEILSSAPVDHAFYSSVPSQPSKAFLGRLQREYRALASSLPESIVVRAYEDRADLLRSLIIGPENTPYQDAPFVIDWMLDSNFPQSPPIAHFLSWTNGNGRVNPNLYEEGKVCLSILGTWSGEQSETWSAARSSLLQAFVSIQGLVLVKEPWFCEPAYDKLRGTEEGIINSRLYSEKAYVLSRGFIRRALEIPLGGLEREIEWLYYTNGGLEKVLRDSKHLIEVSKSNPEPSPEDKELAVPRLTEGGILTLERTLHKLQDLHDRRQVTPTPTL